MAISIKELRIGNWITNAYTGHIKIFNIQEKTFNQRIDGDGVVGSFSLDHYYPIPLTPEVLEKCGFTKECDGNEYRIGLPLGNGTDLCIEVLNMDIGPYDVLITDRTADEKPNMFSYLKQQRYLHQLQNLYFYLCGEELNYTP